MSQTITARVEEFYNACAGDISSRQGAYNERVATAFGYSAEELQGIPDTANLGLSCGNLLATTNLKEGETLVDLGSGGGLDVFNAAGKVGPTGKAIGVDMTDKMLDLSRKNAIQGGYENVEFIKSNITLIALPDGIADIVCSNCVINLVPEAQKPAVFHEIFRILKPGGRVAISDILAKQRLPEHIRKNPAMLVGCISGASVPDEYERWMVNAGFKDRFRYFRPHSHQSPTSNRLLDIVIMNTKKDIHTYLAPQSSKGNSGCGCGAPAQKNLKCTPASPPDDLNAFVGSYQIYAPKS